jgi:hypothetical protein
MKDRKQTAENRRLHVINRRLVILVAPPFDELNVVGGCGMVTFIPRHPNLDTVRVASRPIVPRFTLPLIPAVHSS